MKNFLVSAAVCVIVLYGVDSLMFNSRYSAAALDMMSHVMR
jgi:hypothetical protein